MGLLRESFSSRVVSDLLTHRRAAEDQATVDIQEKDISKVTSRMCTFDTKYKHIIVHLLHFLEKGNNLEKVGKNEINFSPSKTGFKILINVFSLNTFSALLTGHIKWNETF